MFAKWKMAAKLSLLVGLLVAATLLVGGFGVYSLRQAQEANAASLQVQRDLKDTLNSARAAGTSFRLQILEFRHLLLRGNEKSDYDRFLGSFQRRTEEIRKHLADVQDVMNRAGLPSDGVEDARRLHGSIVAQYLEALKLFDPEKVETLRLVDDRVRGKDRQLEDKIEMLVNALQIYADSEATRVLDLTAAESRQALFVLAGASGGLALLAAVLGFVIIRQLRRALGGEPGYAKEIASRIAGGDLATEVHVDKGDNDSVIAAIRRMQEDLRLVVADVADGARGVADASAQIAQGNQDLSRRTEQQASTLEETASAMEELAANVTHNAEAAREASRLAAAAAEVAGKGGEVVDSVVRTMGGISTSSQRIGDIIGVIDGIAFQTNILALNAAVEAARAGEQGRGFAVVAAEVRTLAQRSADAAKEIKALIGASVRQVEDGSALVAAAGKTMGEIVGSVQRVSSLIAGIAAASQQQNTGLQQVSSAVGQLELVVQQNASMVEEAAAATGSMREQADALVEAIARFRLGTLDVEAPEPEAGDPDAYGHTEPLFLPSRAPLEALPATA
ncbi:Tar ligand binding domain-containing protein [Ramlibacter sp. USB13]|uniref:Tar ligand binding domain-containing protein n=1 Tax=Ramlibacter cellulosilyticus TaxID=2764187 RepID=A0A923MRE7_9BURK|nr:methyl-accepting chemotaxis protein [Ramlibacter cellulosilyticus]MBC5784442.1 Tar ligand binding domain-containing protein [Ramlibacter cellulosilyticus]